MYHILMARAAEKATDATLAAKVQALGQVARACGLQRDHQELARAKTRRGHQEHGDAETVDLFAELRGELADVAGYGGLFRWRGLWTWRLWAIVALAGLQWRLLGPSAAGCDDDDCREPADEDLTLEERVARLPSGGLTDDEFDDLCEWHIQRQEAAGVLEPSL